MPESAIPADLRAVAHSLMLDRRARAAVEQLASAGIPAILLKGAAIATWLYDDGTPRPYRDVDLFVPPSEFERAISVLGDIGYKLRLIGAHPAELGPKELDLVGPDNVAIDLHKGLLGTSAAPERCWEVLTRRTVPMSLAGGEVRVLDLQARALHLALHAAQNGPIDVKAISDLARGVARVPRADWVEAADIAKQIEATEAFGAGLRLVPAGRVLADELELPRSMSIELALRTLSVTQDALFFARWCDTPGAARKTRLLARKFFPTATTLRANSMLATRGRFGLLCARVVHPFELAIRFGPAFSAWYRVRRASRQQVSGRSYGDPLG